MHNTVAGCYSYGRRLACIRLQPGHIRLQVKTLRSHPAEASVMGLAEGSGSAAADLTFAGDGGDEGVSESSTQGAWEKVTLLDMNPSATRAAAAAAAAAATAAAAAAPAAAEGQTSPRAAKSSVVRGFVEMAPGLARPQQPPASSPLAEVRVRELGLGLGLGLGLDSMLTQTLTLTPMARAIFHAGRRNTTQRQARRDAAAPAAAAEGG